jgi:hypothetical protein
VGDFTAEWLAQREAADHAARSARLATSIADALGGRPVRVLDLGAGTGSNLRYLSPRLGVPQHWVLADRDAGLLARAAAIHMAGVEIDTHTVDLAHLDDGAVAALFHERGLVTASALLDLVSQSWIDALADRCREAGAAALFALTYDGRVACSPGDELDDRVRRLVNEHQRGDKGFGSALGPSAIRAAAEAYAARGYVVSRAHSDWTLAPEASELQRSLIDGWAHAATEVAPDQSRAIEAWRARRLAHADAGTSCIVVGHEDLAALPRADVTNHARA